MDIKVDEKAEPQIMKSKVSQQLCGVEGDELIDSLHLYDDTFVNQQIELYMTVQWLAFVGDRHTDLTLYSNTLQPQLPAERSLIYRFQEAGSHQTVYFDRSPNNHPRQI